MKLKHLASVVALAAASLVATSAHAVFINGSASFTGGFEQPQAYTGFPSSIVSTLTTFDVEPLALAVGSSLNLSAVSGLAASFDFNQATPPTVLFTDAGFTFTLLSYGVSSILPFACANGQCADTLAFQGLGSVTGNGYQATGFTMAWSAQGSCNEGVVLGTCGGPATASWSASISATGGAVTVPEPASLALVGLALAGMGLVARRRAAK